MKTISLFFLLFISFGLCGQSKSELNNRILALEGRVATIEKDLNQSEKQNNLLRFKIDSLETQIAQLKLSLSQRQDVITGSQNSTKSENSAENPVKRQCKANTVSGKQCSRDAQPDSDYCWQHKQSHDPGSTKEKDDSKEKVKTTGETYNGKSIQTGPRGGKYYINSSGKKVYIKK